MQVFLSGYFTNTTLLYNQTDWITKQLEHVLEKGSEYQWEIMRGQKQG